MRAWPVWVAALWWGSLTTLGFGVVPLLFVHLPTAALAGAMAAKLFEVQTWVSAVLGLLLLMASGTGLATTAQRTRGTTAFIIGGMLLALLAEFAVAPRIVARENLRWWHGAGSAMYLLQWCCAAATLWRMMKPAPPS